MFEFKQKIKILFLSLFMVLAITPSFVLAQNTTTPSSTSAGQATQARCTKFKSLFTLTGNTSIIGSTYVYCSASELISAVIGYIQMIAGTVSALFLIIGGFMYIAAAGNEEQSEKARKIITNSVIGLVVVIMSFAIVRIAASLATLGK